jgi:hypothetical protein
MPFLRPGDIFKERSWNGEFACALYPGLADASGKACLGLVLAERADDLVAGMARVLPWGFCNCNSQPGTCLSVRRCVVARCYRTSVATRFATQLGSTGRYSEKCGSENEAEKSRNP